MVTHCSLRQHLNKVSNQDSQYLYKFAVKVSIMSKFNRNVYACLNTSQLLIPSVSFISNVSLFSSRVNEVARVFV